MKPKIMIEIGDGCKHCRFCEQIGHEAPHCVIFGKYIKKFTRDELCIDAEVKPVVQIIAPSNVEINLEQTK